MGATHLFFAIDMKLKGKENNTTDVLLNKYRGFIGTNCRRLKIDRATEVDSPFEETTTGEWQEYVRTKSLHLLVTRQLHILEEFCFRRRFIQILGGYYNHSN